MFVCIQTTLRPKHSPVNNRVEAILAALTAQRYPKLMKSDDQNYFLDDQVGFVLRRVTQRHLSIFSDLIPELTTTQFATLAKLAESGPLSQNLLGRKTAMDAATIKGVVDRLRLQGLIETRNDKQDKRRLTVALTADGQALFDRLASKAHAVTAKTLQPLSEAEATKLLELLHKLT